MAFRRVAFMLMLSALACGKIDRQGILSRFNVVRSSLIDNTTTPLQVGNGNFAFGVDNTGMQTFLPFNTLSSWGWHTDSVPNNGESVSDYHGMPVLTHGRNVSYDLPDQNLPEATQWIIANSNRINLGRIGLRYMKASLSETLITEPRQELDLWNGVITSTFKVHGVQVTVVTQGDFESDAVVFRIESDLLMTKDLEVELDFPYPPVHTSSYKFEVFVGSYDFPLNHTTSIARSCKTRTHIYHEMQATKYYTNLRWPSSALLELKKENEQNPAARDAHRYTLSPVSTMQSMEFTVHFSPNRVVPDLPSVIGQRNRAGWNQYWSDGGFVDLTSSSNVNATELQRRILLSQYHVRVNSAASGQSPQESGLANNGWYGKFHFEMFVWHNAHWVTWGRKKLFDSVFPAVYETFLSSSLTRATNMGWQGARWPKMTEVDSQVSSPGAVNAFLVWQQPHTMYLAELAYKAAPTLETLERWDTVLTAAANYMASYAWSNGSSGYFDLGPPAYGVTENTPPMESLNLAYEVAYWRYGLDIAQTWKQRLCQPVPSSWTTVSQNLAPLPIADDGLYSVYQGLNSSWWTDVSLTGDPRSVIMLKGILPDTPAVDFDTAVRTANKVDQVWTDTKIGGWGRPVLAINSARIGNPARAIRHLTAYDYFKFDDAGFCVRGGTTPPPFISGNAAFLYSVAYAAVGWQGSESDTPGFPKDGTWTVKSEGLMQAL